MHVKKIKDWFQEIYDYVKKLFLIILFGLTIYLIYTNQSDILKLFQSQQYQYWEIINFEWYVLGLDWHNIVAQSIDNKKYIIKSTVIDISRIKWKNKFSAIIIWYDNGIYILDIKNIKQENDSIDLSYIYNKNMQIYIQIPKDSEIYKNYTITNTGNQIILKNNKTNINEVVIWLFDCSDCKNKTTTSDFANNVKLSFVKVSDKERLVNKNNIYLPIKIQSTDQFLLYKLSQYMQFTDSDWVYDYINQNISNICNDNNDYMSSIDEFTTKYQNNQKFVIIKWITKNWSKYVCQVKLSDDVNKFDANLVNFYKIE